MGSVDAVLYFELFSFLFTVLEILLMFVSIAWFFFVDKDKEKVVVVLYYLVLLSVLVIPAGWYYGNLEY